MSCDPVPVVETERVIMRGFRDGDLEDYMAWAGDPEVMRFLGGTVGRATGWRTLATYLGHWVMRGYGLWACERRSDGRVIGRVGLWNPEGWPGVEVGWTLARDAWGQGYARECGAAALAWGWANLPDTRRIVSIIEPTNRASRNVAEHLNMTVVGPYLLGGELPTVLYGIDRP